jgi:hypothetical protein
MKCFASKSKHFRHFGGGKRDRTADLLHAMQALSQLSYTPLGNFVKPWKATLVGVEKWIIDRFSSVFQAF